LEVISVSQQNLTDWGYMSPSSHRYNVTTRSAESCHIDYSLHDRTKADLK